MTVRRRSWLRRVVVGLLTVEIVYVAVTSIGLNFGLFPRLLNGSQKDVVLDYDVAWSLLPGLASVRGLKLRGQDSNVEWQLTADRVTTYIDLFHLAAKTFSTSIAHVNGATFRVRARREPEALCAADAEGLPPIPGYFNPPEPGGDRAECLARAAQAPHITRGGPPNIDRLWKVVLARVQGQGLRELWLERYRLRGDVQVAGGLDFWPTQRVAVTPASLVVTSGTVAYDRKTIAEGLDVDAGLRLEETDSLATRGSALLRGLSVTATVGAGLKSLDFLNSYLRSVEAVRFDGGSGAVSAHIALERGVIQPGTTLSILAHQLRARVLDQLILGSGKVDWRTERDARAGRPPVGRLDVELTEYAIYEPGRKHAHIEGRGLEIRASSRALDLTNPFGDLDARFELPSAKVPRFRDYQDLLPSGLGLEILSGSATIQGELRVRAGDRVDTGRLDLIGDDIHVRYRGLELRGAIGVHTRIQDGDLGVPRLPISGTRVEVRDVSVVETGKAAKARRATKPETKPARPEVERWWAKVTVPRGLLTPGKAKVLDADAHIEMRDLRPLLALFAEAHALPKVVQGFLDVDGVEGDLHLALGEALVDVPRLHVRGDGLTCDAVFLSAAGRPEGALRLDLGAVKVTLALDRGATRFHLFDATSAFQIERGRVEAARARLGLARGASGALDPSNGPAADVE